MAKHSKKTRVEEIAMSNFFSVDVSGFKIVLDISRPGPPRPMHLQLVGIGLYVCTHASMHVPTSVEHGVVPNATSSGSWLTQRSYSEMEKWQIRFGGRT